MIVKKMWFLNILYLFLVTCTCVRDSGFVHLRAMLEDLMALALQEFGSCPTCLLKITMGFSEKFVLNL